MSPQYWQAIAAFVAACAALYGVVTVPLLRALKAEIGLSEARMKLLVTELKTEIAGMEGRLKTEMVGMEARLNERIDTRLVHR